MTARIRKTKQKQECATDPVAGDSVPRGERRPSTPENNPRAQNANDLINEDPQLAARGFWRDTTHDVFGDRTIDTFPALWNGRRLPASALSPSYLGEHNFEVWTQLAGLDFEEVAEGVGNGLFN